MSNENIKFKQAIKSVKAEPTKTKLSKIEVTPNGKILNIELVVTSIGPRISIARQHPNKSQYLIYSTLSDLKADIESGYTIVANISNITDNSIEIPGLNLKNIEIITVTPDPKITVEDIQVQEVVYEKLSRYKIYKQMRLIHSLTLKPLTEKSRETLEILGFMPNPTNPTHLTISSIWLRHLLAKDSYYLKLFDTLGIQLALENLVIITDEGEKRLRAHSYNIKLTENNIIRKQYTKWAEKMKLIGLYDNYEVNEDSLILTDYKGKPKDLIIPPVISIELNSDTQVKGLKQLKIPSTVHTIKSFGYKSTSEINFGNQGSNLIDLHHSILCEYLDTLDTQNLSCNLSVNSINKLIYRLQFGSKYKIYISEHLGKLILVENQGDKI